MLNLRPVLLFGFLVLFVIACFMGLLSMNLLIQDAFATPAGNCSTREVNTKAPSDPIVTVRKYFYAVKNKNLNEACSYFDPKAIIAIRRIHKPVTIKLMKSLVGWRDALISYSIFTMQSVSGNQVLVYVDVIHGSKNRLSEIHLWLRMEGGGWKIERVEFPSE